MIRDTWGVDSWTVATTSAWTRRRDGWLELETPVRTASSTTTISFWDYSTGTCTDSWDHDLVRYGQGVSTAGTVRYSTYVDFRGGHGLQPFRRSPESLMKQILESRHAPRFINSSRHPLQRANDVREERARETLRRVVGEGHYRNFLKCGFVSVRAKSGLVYQIFPAHGITAVYDKGRLCDRLCVVLQGQFPPTDSLIMRYIMLLNNEKQFRDLAISHGTPRTTYPTEKKVDMRSLPQIYNEIRKRA